MKYIKYILVTYILVYLLSSCKPIQYTSRSGDQDFSQFLKKRIENKGSDYYAVEQIDFKLNDGDIRNFKGKIYCSKGNYIFGSLSFLGIELGRFELSRDSIKLINRVDRKYYFDKISAINNIVKLDLSYDQVESLLLKGLVFENGITRKKILSHINETDSTLAFNYNNGQGLTVNSYFNKRGFEENEIEIMDRTRNFYLKAEIMPFRNEGRYPEKIHVDLKSDRYIAELELNIGKVSNKKFERKAFNINSRYSEISF